MAELGITVNTGQMPQAIADLDRLAPAAARAEAAAEKLGAATTRAASQVGAGVGQINAQLQQAASQAETFAMRIERSLNFPSFTSGNRVGTAFESNVGRGQDVAAFGMELDRLRAKFNPTFAAISQYRAQVLELRQAHAVGAISMNEMTTAIDRQRSSTLSLLAAQRQAARGAPGGVVGGGRMGAGGGAQGQLSGNLMYQFQDIAVTTAMGMSPAMIALQQGTQIGAALTASGGARAGIMGLTTALGSMFSIMNLLPIAVIGFGAAAYQYFTGADSKAKTLNETLKEHQKALDEVAKAYGVAGLSAEEFGKKSEAAIDGAERRARAALQDKAADESGSALGQLRANIFQKSIPLSGMVALPPEAAFLKPMDDLMRAGADSKEDFDAFEKSVEAIVRSSPGMRKFADEVMGVVDAAREANTQLSGTAAILNKMGFGDIHPELGGPLTDRQSVDQRNDAMNARARATAQIVQEEIAHAQRVEEAWARVDIMIAKSPEEIEKATRRLEEARVIPGESSTARTDRIGIAATEAYGRALFEINEAEKQRGVNRERQLATQQMELELVGKTTEEQSRLRKEFELTNELKDYSAQHHIPMGEKELELIRAQSAEYAKMAAAIQQANLAKDVAFEREQLFRSPGEATIAGRLRGTGLGMDSQVASDMRWNQNFADAKESAKSFLKGIGDAIVEGGDDIGKNIMKAIAGGIESVIDKLLDRLLDSISNDIASALMGSSGGGGGGILSGLFGGGGGGGATAAFGSAGGFMSMLFGDGPNTAASASRTLAGLGGTGGGGVGGSDLIKGMSSALGRGGVPLATVMFQGKPVQVDAAWAGNFAKLSAFMDQSGYKVGSVGEGGFAGVNRMVAGTNSFSQHAYGRAVDINPRANPWSYSGRNDYNFNPHEAERVSGLEWGGDWRKPDTMHWQVPRGASSSQGMGMDKLDKSVTRMAATSDAATKDIAGLGRVGANASKGLGEFGDALSKFPAAPGGGGGFLGGAGSGGGNFGGGFQLPSFDFMNSISPLATQFILGGGVGLFHGGGEVGSGGNYRYGIDPHVFYGAPRFHSGLAADEFPAILQSGERVVPRGGGANDNSARFSVNVFPIAGDTARVEKRTGADGSVTADVFIDRMVAEKVNTRGTLSNNAIRSQGQLKRR